jgi:cobalt-zinc-cadmium efflux system outer membrane protein
MGARAALTICLWASVAQAAPLRLADVVARVEERGPEALTADATVPVARADVRTARMFPNPAITAGVGKDEPIFSAGLQLRLPIFGQIGVRRRAAERALDQTAAEAIATRWKLRHDARVGYYAVARADEEVAIAVEVLALTQRIYDMAREKYEVGSGTRLDERQASLVLVRAQQDVVDRRAVAKVARLELARQLGAPVEDLGEVADPLQSAGTAPPIDELLREALARHPEQRALQAEREAALARRSAARAELRPSLSLELDLLLLDSSTCNAGNDMGPRCLGPRGALGFDLPIFNWNGGPVERAEAEARLADAKRRANATRIDAEVRSAYENLTAAKERARFFDSEYVPNASQVEQMAREGFAVGKSGILPLIEAQRAVLDARLGRAEALFAVQTARADLEESSGVPLSMP